MLKILRSSHCKAITVSLAVFLSTILSGCGFALKKPQPLPFHEVQLIMTGCPQVKNALNAYLTSHALKVTEDGHELRPILTVQCPVLEKEPLVYDGEGQLRRQRLFYKLTAELTTTKSHVIELKTIREQQLNSNQSLGDEAEASVIIKEMQTSLFYQLITQLSKAEYANNLSRA